MRISIFGAGYVGLVTAACFAELGNQVICFDIDKKKIEELKNGLVSIHEPNLTELIQKNLATGYLRFTSDIQYATQESFYLFITVGTPSLPSGAADLSYIHAVVKNISENLIHNCIIISKSTVPVGTADIIQEKVLTILKQRKLNIEVEVASNPEFLCQGAAIKDFMDSERIIIGTSSEKSKEALLSLYSYFKRKGSQIICMDTRSAELTKYAANAMLAARISFMNELSLVAEKVGADIDFVRQGIASDPRIGNKFLQAGCGYGGSCFPKDVQALQEIGKNAEISLSLIGAIHDRNEKQKLRLFEKIYHYFDKNLKDKTFALWGLSFKPNTDDMREAPSRTLIESLWEHGARVQAYDPVANKVAQKIYGARSDLIFYDNPEDALKDADALVIVTEWEIFFHPNFDLIKSLLKTPVIFDGRNIYNPSTVKKAGFSYFGIGRGDSIP